MNTPSNGGARGTSVPDPPEAHDLVAGDGQTIERVINMLCREFGYNRHEHPTIRSVVVSLRTTIRTSGPVNRSDQDNAFTQDAVHPVFAELNALLLSPVEKPPSALEIVDGCLWLAKFLLEKNKKYGDSALNPLRIFSKADPAEQIRVRIDDKLSRMFRGVGVGEDEDPLLDLVGYWVLKTIAERRLPVAIGHGG